MPQITPASVADPVAFADGLHAPSPLRAAITAACRLAEPQALPPLLEQARQPPAQVQATAQLARQLAQGLRDGQDAGGLGGWVQGLMHEYALSSPEGVALMCLAEALLRIPHAATRDALIRDKIAHGQWQIHVGRSPSLFVNAATWGLVLTGKLVATQSEAGLASALSRLLGKGGAPLIRKALDGAMRLLGQQFVVGETIAQALQAAPAREAAGFRYSYDMLGEAAHTADDAQRYMAAYETAIHAIGQAAAGRGVLDGPGISIKLSALHPRYGRAQYARVMDELYPRLRSLALLARHYDMGLHIDAEEADRLELSLDLLERLCFEPALAGWDGVGTVVQAYQKRCPCVIDWLVDLARRSHHRLLVRLVKGAYWDSEIKRAQTEGLDGYPVYTRKAYTDVAYLACARQLLTVPDAVFAQFATHNAQTLAAVYQMADPDRWYPGQYEFQCLHGMGEPLYEQVTGSVDAGQLARPCRIYAPVGSHDSLLAYLVRRLLENGANTSFIHCIADRQRDLDTLVEDPLATVQRMAQVEGALGLPHPAIPLPRHLYGAARVNARGLDLASDAVLRRLDASVQLGAHQHWTAAPMLAADTPGRVPTASLPVRNPADLRDIVGQVSNASAADVQTALATAHSFAPVWGNTPAAVRAKTLDAAATLLEENLERLLLLMAREAGKTFANGVAEVREAADFLRYYAAQVRGGWTAQQHVALGPVVCISPWNFPLAIFIGQVAAALAAGNTVLAKPAEQTPLVAAEAVRLLRCAGVPAPALQLLPGPGATVGASLVADARVNGVLFTGSTEVARLLQASLAQRLSADARPVVLIAETGGQNAMLVDASALLEQVVVDVMASAFDSAGQRCSALRVLCVQAEVADRLLDMLRGAMAQWRIGVPTRLAVDMGPVIDAAACARIEHHVAQMQARGCLVHRAAGVDDAHLERGSFVLPTLIEIESLDVLQREVFGPVLHVLRYARQDMDSVLAQIRRTGYGLTLGVHTRIDETVAQVLGATQVGNVYVNRNMVGAVVGVQPFGGAGLSGTGPKAGGPLYLYRLLARRPDDVLQQVMPPDARVPQVSPNLLVLAEWVAPSRPALAAQCLQFARQARHAGQCLLAGPTGERNQYFLQPRAAVLCLADQADDCLIQLAAVLAVGSVALWPDLPLTHELHARLPKALTGGLDGAVRLVPRWQDPVACFDIVLHHGSATSLVDLNLQLAQRPGPLVGVRAMQPGAVDVPLEALLLERSCSTNTAAAGGNASLLAMD